MPPALDIPATDPQPPSSAKSKPQVIIRQKTMEQLLGREPQGHGLLALAQESLPSVGQPALTPSRSHLEIPLCTQSPESVPKGQVVLLVATSRSEIPIPPPILVTTSSGVNKRAITKFSPMSQSTISMLQETSNIVRKGTPIPAPVRLATRFPSQSPTAQITRAAANLSIDVSTSSLTSSKRPIIQVSPVLEHPAKKKRTASNAGNVMPSNKTSAPNSHQSSPAWNEDPRNPAQQAKSPSAVVPQANSMVLETPSSIMPSHQSKQFQTNLAAFNNPSTESLALPSSLNSITADAFEQNMYGGQATASFLEKQNAGSQGGFGHIIDPAAGDSLYLLKQIPPQREMTNELNTGRDLVHHVIPQTQSPALPFLTPLFIQQKAVSITRPALAVLLTSVPNPVGKESLRAPYSAEHVELEFAISSGKPESPTRRQIHAAALHTNSRELNLAQENALEGPRQYKTSSAIQETTLHQTKSDSGVNKVATFTPRIPSNIPFQNPSLQIGKQATSRKRGRPLAQVHVPSPLAQVQRRSLSPNLPQPQNATSSHQILAPISKTRSGSFEDSNTQVLPHKSLGLKKHETAMESRDSSPEVICLDWQLIPAQSPRYQAQNSPHSQRSQESASDVSDARTSDTSASPTQSRQLHRPYPLAGLSKQLISDARHFLLYFGKYIGYPRIFLPRTDINQCLDNILVLLRSYHGIEKILGPEGWEIEDAFREGLRFGSAVFNVSLDLPGYDDVADMMPNVVQFFEAQEQAAARLIQDMDFAELEEFNLAGKASWYFAQQMEQAFFSQVKLSIIVLFKEEVDRKQEASKREAQKQHRKEEMIKRYEEVRCGTGSENVDEEQLMATNISRHMVKPASSVAEPRIEIAAHGNNELADTNVHSGMFTFPGAGVRAVPKPLIYNSQLAIPSGFRAPSSRQQGQHTRTTLSRHEARLQIPGTETTSPINAPRIKLNFRKKSQNASGQPASLPDLAGQVANLDLNQRGHAQDEGKDIHN